MSSRLVPLTPGYVNPILLQRPVILIGRHPECDIRIDTPQISRRHCCVALAYNRVVLRDLGSRNGVRVNGELVQETSLQHGDEIAIGHLLYRLEAIAVQAPPAPRPLTPRPAVIPPSPAPVASNPAPVAPNPPAPSPRVYSDDDLVPLDDDLF